MWECGNVGMWETGNLGIWESGHLGIWASGNDARETHRFPHLLNSRRSEPAVLLPRIVTARAGLHAKGQHRWQYCPAPRGPEASRLRDTRLVGALQG